ncbi:MAG TPA: EamA family transporter, partial [Thermoanaerobaculia bacterium]|nr:EamA family transporter [Thermoanaerobaculia bacterium]
GWTRLRGEPAPQARNWPTAFLVGGLMLLGGNGLVTWAEKRVPSGLAALIVASVPLWMALLDGIQKRTKPRLPVVAGLLAGLAGLLVLVAPGRFAGHGGVDLLGAGALLLAALCWTTGSLYSRHHAKLPSSVLTSTAMQMIGGGTLLWIVGLAGGEGSRLDLASVSSRSLLSLAYLIVFGSLLGFSAYVWLLRSTTPARVSTYAYVNPVVAVLLGWAFAGEAITLRIVLATVAIVGSVALIIRYGGSRPSVPARKEKAA